MDTKAELQLSNSVLSLDVVGYLVIRHLLNECGTSRAEKKKEYPALINKQQICNTDNLTPVSLSYSLDLPTRQS